MAENLNQTPNANRVHIAFFGKRNAGKSSVVNAVTGQNLSIVSDVLGTTTDPVSKAMELLPVGPVVIIDTPGIDDSGEIGELRVQKTKQILNKTDVAVLVVDSVTGKSDCDEELIALFKAKEIPYIVVYNKFDLKCIDKLTENEISVSAKTCENINALKEIIALFGNKEKITNCIICDKLKKDDIVILVTPIDGSAPKGRMILPQVQTIRDILDAAAVCVTVQPEQLSFTLDNLKTKPKLVVTDSQVFGKVKQLVPDDIPLTSFSILMANFKGILKTAVKGAASIEKLKNGDIVLISEGCTHHRQCEDIGTVKLPNWLEQYTNKDFKFEFTSGGEFPEDLSKYALVIHCGGCMLNEKEMLYRQKSAETQNIPFTNYGTAIAYMNGILKRSLEIFPEIQNEIL
ncbi:MAG: [FeFe] hydrogenase H-cluster maturation GTPase HydF [Eubacterium sp.]|nr:[FeFe] hydrogenase H-cluster maturation GTPase HydF [Eubacterium sp.]